MNFICRSGHLWTGAFLLVSLALSTSCTNNPNSPTVSTTKGTPEEAQKFIDDAEKRLQLLRRHHAAKRKRIAIRHIESEADQRSLPAGEIEREIGNVDLVHERLQAHRSIPHGNRTSRIRRDLEGFGEVVFEIEVQLFERRGELVTSPSERTSIPSNVAVSTDPRSSKEIWRTDTIGWPPLLIWRPVEMPAM